MTTKITRIETEQYSFPCECCEDEAPCQLPGGLADEYYMEFRYKQASTGCTERVAQGVLRHDPDYCPDPSEWCNPDANLDFLTLKFVTVPKCGWQVIAEVPEMVWSFKYTGQTPVGEYTEDIHPTDPCGEIFHIEAISAFVSEIVN